MNTEKEASSSFWRSIKCLILSIFHSYHWENIPTCTFSPLRPTSLAHHHFQCTTEIIPITKIHQNIHNIPLSQDVGVENRAVSEEHSYTSLFGRKTPWFQPGPGMVGVLSRRNVAQKITVNHSPTLLKNHPQNDVTCLQPAPTRSFSTGLPRVFVPGLVFFSGFIGKLEDKTQAVLSNYGGGTKAKGVVILLGRGSQRPQETGRVSRRRTSRRRVEVTKGKSTVVSKERSKSAGQWDQRETEEATDSTPATHHHTLWTGPWRT